MAERMKTIPLGEFVITTTTLTGSPVNLPRSDAGWVFAATMTVNAGGVALTELRIETSMDGVIWTDLVVFPTTFGAETAPITAYAKVSAPEPEPQRDSDDSVDEDDQSHMMLPQVRAVAVGTASVDCTIRMDVTAL